MPHLISLLLSGVVGEDSCPLPFFFRADNTKSSILDVIGWCVTCSLWVVSFCSHLALTILAVDIYCQSEKKTSPLNHIHTQYMGITRTHCWTGYHWTDPNPHFIEHSTIKQESAQPSVGLNLGCACGFPSVTKEAPLCSLLVISSYVHMTDLTYQTMPGNL